MSIGMPRKRWERYTRAVQSRPIMISLQLVDLHEKLRNRYLNLSKELHSWARLAGIYDLLAVPPHLIRENYYSISEKLFPLEIAE